MKINFEEYSHLFLEKSWEWLQDSEIKHLINAPYISREQQQQWFETLPQRKDYFIKGISYNEMPIGVLGLKNIDLTHKKAEYWGYIGEKEYWGKGLSSQMFDYILKIAKEKYHLKQIYLNVIPENTRAIRAYEKVGFKHKIQENKNIQMFLIL